MRMTTRRTSADATAGPMARGDVVSGLVKVVEVC
jgi:hypothetical protein